MKVHVISDIHLEDEASLMREHRAPDGTDVVVVAGDVHPGVFGVIWASQRFAGLPVIYVPGNHEYYGKRGFKRHLERMRAKAAESGGNVRVVDRDAIMVGDVRFLCATLWTDYNLWGTPGKSMKDARAGMNDYKWITGNGHYSWNISPSTLLLEHETSLQWLAEQMSIPFAGTTVVISHHAPSRQSLGVVAEEDIPLSPCYATDLEWLMHEHRPDVWIHGHAHKQQDYQIGSTRVLSNPRGWVSRKMKNGERLRENPLFDPGFLLTA